jgi:hypothetical protein
MVSYDFKDEPENHQALFDALRRFGGWWHFIDGTWLIETDADAKSIHRDLQPYLNDNINLLIAEVGQDMSGWLPPKAWDWIQQHRSLTASA